MPICLATRSSIPNATSDWRGDPAHTRSNPRSVFAMFQPPFNPPTTSRIFACTSLRKTSQNSSDRAYLDPRLIHFEHDKRDAGLLLGGFVGAHESEHMGCVEGHARPNLVSVDDNRLAFDAAFGAQAGKIRTCVGLRVALTPHAFSSQNPGQIFISL